MITGAAGGIGRACAQRLAAVGFRVYAGVRHPEDADSVSRLEPNLISAFHLDVTDEQSIWAAVAHVESLVGADGLSGLINNAGICVPFPLEFVPIQSFRSHLEVNVVGVVAVTQGFLPLLRRRGGRIVNIGSIAGLTTTPFLGAYGASKFALEAVTDALRGELRPWRMEVSIIEPGSIATPIWQKAVAHVASLGAAASPEARALYGPAFDAVQTIVRRAEERAIQPQKVAAAVCHALTATRPRTRYLIGTDARLRLILQALPDRWRDSVFARYLPWRGPSPDAGLVRARG